ncbi:uncharacterized protein LOC129773546 [Toxorhynchites rutilus septentrionalis]|uniref:uncharacterized protein LOC129773546 n=1 Tax=Toxorhynchites rutilus septentrionalis TaxID=329112 RepID=UPI002479F465|nr:uncharacterized protein LOC129773546 [Toxorhynchites rutilus septentrionalis]
MRSESRLESANFIQYDARFPIILPRGHHATNLLLDWYHRKYRHENGEIIVNEIRQRFSIARLRIEVRKAAKRCQWCRVFKAVPNAPRMAALPPARLMPFIRPFTCTGIDYFGPYLIKIGISCVKRWVALFTCLTIRAVHLEPVTGLTTDSCKKAIRRFIARRGAPQEIFSDQGTNFIGASRELRAEVEALNNGLASTFTDTYTQWHFNPPASPHMGGCWERMVRAVKAAINCVPEARKLDEESFHTLLTEAESMINSRPLTYIPLKNSEEESLTPNHFLLLNSKGTCQPMKTPVQDGIVLRSSWNLIQNVLDRFWNRWVKEYLPTISRRTKWFSDTRPIKVGDLVVVVDDQVRNKWVRGRVLKVFPGKDGRVRKVELQTSTGVYQRPVVKLALLDVEGSSTA